MGGAGHRALKRTLLLILLNVALLLIIEGLASTIMVARIVTERMRPRAEHVHTKYDAELGWVNMPSLFIADMYGPGVSLRTNAQGFRNDESLTSEVPPTRVRVVCSGDSFTLGYGVSNDQAWCNQLAAIDPRLEPVNMGQGGYGLDQAYLWYRRDGTRIDHDIQILALILNDFGRMREASFLGYPKPVLALARGQLVTRNVPVPHRSEFGVKLRELIWTIARLRTVQLIQSWVRSRATTSAGAATDGGRLDPLRPIVASVFQSLRDLHRQRGSVLVLVYLPTRTDYDTEQSSAWRDFVREQAGRDQIPLVDLVDEMRAVPAHEIGTYFIGPGELAFVRSEGHYSVRGNEFIARALYRRLLALDAVAVRLNHARGPGR